MLKAGFGKSVITPKVGTRLVGYANRTALSTGVHDDLHARALVVESAGSSWAICAAELCYLRESQVRRVREIVQSRTELPSDQILLCAVHSHSAPDDRDALSWHKPLADLIADAILKAFEGMQPARIGAASGFLHGWSINRRWLDRAIDPFVGVIRIDDEEGKPMGVVSNFGCHAVVLGYDNLLVSADWPGVTSSAVEKELGPQSVCVVTQGGSGDVNPLTEQVRQRLRSGIAIGTMRGKTYYGAPSANSPWNIGDRGGGTFQEARDLGLAVAEEILHVTKTVKTQADVRQLWAQQIRIDGSRQPDDLAYELSGEVPHHVIERPESPSPDGKRWMEFMVLAAEEPGLLIVSQPGEVFAETAMEFRRRLQTMGVVQPWTVGYANGWQLYLPPETAFPEGGYEVDWAVHLGISPRLQNRLWDSLLPILRQHHYRGPMSAERTF